MNVPAHPRDGSASTPGPARGPIRDKATLERIFGVEPSSTRDDLPDPEPTPTADDWYRDNRPPHHG